MGLPRSFLAAARCAARCCDDKMGQDIRVWDVRRLSGMTDFFVVASVESSPQLRAMENHLTRILNDRMGLKPLRCDGDRSPHWVAVDYGGMVAHLMHTSCRAFYGLERLWEGARRVSWVAARGTGKKGKK